MQKEDVINKKCQKAFMDGILKRWYPLVIDKEFGDTFTNVSHDWKLAPQQEK